MLFGVFGIVHDGLANSLCAIDGHGVHTHQIAAYILSGRLTQVATYEDKHSPAALRLLGH